MWFYQTNLNSLVQFYAYSKQRRHTLKGICFPLLLSFYCMGGPQYNVIFMYVPVLRMIWIFYPRSWILIFIYTGSQISKYWLRIQDLRSRIQETGPRRILFQIQDLGSNCHFHKILTPAPLLNNRQEINTLNIVSFYFQDIF